MSFRALTALALLILAVAAERCGYYAVRSVLVLDLTRGGLASTEAINIHQALTVFSYGAAFAGGGLAFAFGPRVTALIGASVAAAGAFALAGGAPTAFAFCVAALGAGIFKASPYAAAAEILADEDGGAAQGFLPTPRRFASFATFAVLTYGAVNVGAFIAPIVTGVLRQTRDGGGFGSTYGFAGTVDVLAVMLAGGMVFLASRRARTLAQQAHAPYRGPDGAPLARPAMPVRTNDVFVPLGLLGIVFAALHFVMDRARPDRIEMGLTNVSWLFTMNPIIVLVMTVPCGVLFFVLALQRSTVPLTRVLGVGLLVFGFGGVLAVVAMTVGQSVSTWAPALAIIAIGESIVFPLGLTYAALAVRSRAATMVVAGWITLTAVPDYLFGMWTVRLHVPAVSTAIVVVAVLVVLLGGVLVLQNAARLHRDLAG